ncbi:hypothetical protein [Actinomadura sp. WMMA1423]|uniref:hypothetical protein n=1 Tax=Actinomadura sp. WMMA1423 TaxID=2591108 RepID=UPI00114753A7|nr:hypothetical protein [Actinomadura sp. WMMA1423]
MTDLMDRESALDGLVERGDALHTVIEKVGEYAPVVAEMMELLTTASDQVTDGQLDEFADQSLDLRRTNMAILVALLHDAFLSLGALLATIDMDEWLGEDDAISAARDALDGLAGALATITARIRPAGGRE